MPIVWCTIPGAGSPASSENPNCGEMMETARLCYISGQRAYFTTRSLDEQWGDDWDDAPYEHNAGEPYPASLHYVTFSGGKRVDGSDYTDGVPNWRIYYVLFATELQQPQEGHCNSPWSVADINALRVPWLASEDGTVAIMAGITLTDFRRAIEATGGAVGRVEELT